MILLIQYTLIFASVLILVALGGCISEHSGVINLGLEGIMVIGALGGALMMRFMPESRMTSCNWLRRSLIVPHFGVKVRISWPYSWMVCGKMRPLSEVFSSCTKGAIPVVINSTFLAFILCVYFP